MSQYDIVRTRKKINIRLSMLCLILVVWFCVSISDEVKRIYRDNQPLTANRIEFVRENSSIVIMKISTGWQVIKPYQQKASDMVVDALLGRLQHGCRKLEKPPARSPILYADIIVDDKIYHIGELNHASDEVYVKQQTSWLLCDKLLVAMALAPAINFIDKQLYAGELKTIVGEFGHITDLAGIDLSVMEVAPANAKALPKNAISKLTLVGDDRRTYQVFLSDDAKHLLLFDKKKSLIYVVASNIKIKSIMGMR